jgi:hypothetical protein
MPEVITKHPEVVKEVLASAGARCGAGEPQKILTSCPRERFCALSGGEICVYSEKELREMTQLSRADLCEIRAQGAPPAGGPLAAAFAEPAFGAMLPVALAGAVLLLRRRARRR